MVTDYWNHWNSLADKETSYPVWMIYGLKDDINLYQDNVRTIFVRLNKETQEIESVWEGSIYDIQRKFNTKYNEYHMYFKVNIKSQLSNKEEYSTRGKGWHIELNESTSSKPFNLTDNSEFHPPLFRKLLLDSKWAEFEDYTYYLIRLLGIHSAYKFNRDEQSGRADGFFMLGTLAVIYDCTLEKNSYEKRKREQVNNYCNQLRKGVMEVADKTTEHFSDYHKQVWLITRSKSQLINTQAGIPVKEVSISDLIDIYTYRLKNPIGQDELENQLRNIGSIR
jgi:hypothetical protein